MLLLPGAPGARFCDGLSRRQFLQIGGLALGGLSLPGLLRAEERRGIRNSHKSVIMVFLPGGPAHQDLFDLKPEAPSEVRGEFKPISTNVAGVQICELLPKLARQMDKTSIIRSLVGCRDEHASNICMTGYTEAEWRQNNAPTMGSVVSRLLGPADKTIPPYINLQARTQHMPYNETGPGFVGLEHSALRPEGELMQDMTLKGISLERLRDRHAMLGAVDRFRRSVDSLKGVDGLTRRALDILTSSKLVSALDLSKEDPKVRESYGKGTDKPVGDASPMINEQFLAARRLVEAGARFVTVSYGFWDWHGSNFSNLKTYLPMLDQALSALIEDVYQRGLDKDVSIVVWGEFGRTPKINADAGRDHWPRVSCALLSGGGMKTGQIIGKTTPYAEEPEERPVHYADVFATLYHNLGIDIENTAVPDVTGRPNYLLAGHTPVAELM